MIYHDTPPLAGRIGGKSRLAGTIVERLPAHRCYVEPFAGAAWVLFRKPESKVEVINDINREVVTLYRCLQWHPEEFMRFFKWALVSRDEFARLQKADPDTLTDIQRAARFYYLQRTAFGGKVINQAFGYAATAPSHFNLLRIEEQLSAAHLRLCRVYVECLPYAEVIRRYDRQDTCFYVDPPYFGSEHYYGRGLFSREDFGVLAGLLAGIKGKFLLSLNDTPEVREIFAGFDFEDVRTMYSVGKDENKAVREVLIKNFRPKLQNVSEMPRTL